MFVEGEAFAHDPGAAGVTPDPMLSQNEISPDVIGRTDHIADQNSGASQEALLEFGRVCVASGLMAPRQRELLDVIPVAASLLEGEQVAGERPSAGTIIDALRGPVPMVDRADRLANASQRLRPVVDRVVASQFDRSVERARKRVEALKPNTIAAIERHIAALAKAKVPGEDVEEEITRLDDEIRQEIEIVRSGRVTANRQPEALVPLPGGIKGVALRVFRAVRKFFSFGRSSRPEVNPQHATANDFAVAVHGIVERGLSDYPILSTFAGYMQKLPLQAYAALAPELMAALASVKKANVDDALSDDPVRTSIQNNPYEFRGLAKWIVPLVAGRSRHLALRGFGLSHLQYASENLLPAVIGVLRTVTGDQIRTLKDRADNVLLQPRPPRQQEPPPERQRRVRNSFRRRRETESAELRPRRSYNLFRRRSTEVVEPRARGQRLSTVRIASLLPRRRRRRRAGGLPEAT